MGVACALVNVPRLIEMGDGSTLTVTWADDRTDRLEASYLRAACPCAGCQGVASSAPGARVLSVAAVGNYAVTVTFSPDGHRSGIFPFDLLRSLGTDQP